ncbi:MAG: tRNA-dihydrouridine synthase family protein [Sutterellaceae bacterium]|nr:tRNA-dihydrouridine synthase family protein [Sutterellaceae bacterium]MDD7442769.1 tRNA-dihydrouridine synthase family protein [Sutterellaceae bacterium]MDY2867616.1 tRNA-dihydrouridine synthase family protein [Mesosutterella sp.]
MKLTLAPMESLTGIVFRRRHHEIFGGADLYYTPFVTPTVKPEFTERQMKELSPERNAGMSVVPQLLTRTPENFIWAAKRLAEMGYPEVNLNLGCPMGTVTGKGKGSGFLRHPLELEEFFERVFDAGIPIRISVKTRLGWADDAEFEDLARVYSRFPISELIIHARVRKDFYKGSPRRAAFEAALPRLPMPVGYNGDLRLVGEIREMESSHPGLSSLMIGRAAVANPAIFRMAKGGAAAGRDEITAFHDALMADYTAAFGSVGNTVGHMKQYWFYMKNLFEGGDRLFKALLKAKRASDYEEIVRRITKELPIREEPAYGWWKPA